MFHTCYSFCTLLTYVWSILLARELFRISLELYHMWVFLHWITFLVILCLICCFVTLLYPLNFYSTVHMSVYIISLLDKSWDLSLGTCHFFESLNDMKLENMVTKYLIGISSTCLWDTSSPYFLTSCMDNG